ncbi:MAG TPA: AIR synthase related protein [Polyangiaceae bacterium]|nr:AIR synthase related protein [Polyangiaceae bacterium]
MSHPERDLYAQAGVDYGTMDPGKRRAQLAALRTARTLSEKGLSEVTESRGESAYVVDFGDHYVSSVTEALGTKNLVADAVRPITGRSHYEQIGKDTVATVLNDLSSVGGSPVSLTAYFGAGDSAWFQDEARFNDLITGWESACLEAGCAWGGGETQVLVGMISPETVVLGGSAVGCIRPKPQLLAGRRIQAGDAILLLEASGIHANGLSLARSIAKQLPRGYATPVPGDPQGRGFGEVLLDATPLYGPAVSALQSADIELHYAVNVTGHGLRKLMRADAALSYIVERMPAPNPIFEFLREATGMSELEAYGTFNMGIGYALYLRADHAPRALQVLEARGIKAMLGGHIESGPKRVVLEPNGLEFSGETLAIR